MICTSFMKPFGNDGLMGRSICRAVRVALSLGRDSRLMNPPGILPAAYMRSSTSTVSGKKSWFSRPSARATAVTSTTVSSQRMRTAPFACLASLPVSRVMVRPPTSTSTVWTVVMKYLRILFWPPHTLRGSPSHGQGTAALFAQLEILDQGTVALHVLRLQVVEQATTVADHHEQSSAGMVILLVDLEVLGEVVDALAEQRHLHFGRPGVAFVLGESRNDRLFVFGRDCQGNHLPCGMIRKPSTGSAARNRETVVR